MSLGVTTPALEPRLVRDEPGYHAFAVTIHSVHAVSRTARNAMDQAAQHQQLSLVTKLSLYGRSNP